MNQAIPSRPFTDVSTLSLVFRLGWERLSRSCSKPGSDLNSSPVFTTVKPSNRIKKIQPAGHRIVPARRNRSRAIIRKLTTVHTNALIRSFIGHLFRAKVALEYEWNEKQREVLFRERDPSLPSVNDHPVSCFQSGGRIATSHHCGNAKLPSDNAVMGHRRSDVGDKGCRLREQRRPSDVGGGCHQNFSRLDLCSFFGTVKDAHSAFDPACRSSIALQGF